MADRNMQDGIEKYQRAGVPVRVSRLLGIDRARDLHADDAAAR